ncbi:MAG: hypothetical protein D6679_04315 [Candidatus Hydrogenedentota bacterium]|nr:MAG: hypothetical protein D6679_04315 [Candidatus Hydrogenedentota bacterium]
MQIERLGNFPNSKMRWIFESRNRFPKGIRPLILAFGFLHSSSPCPWLSEMRTVTHRLKNEFSREIFL